MGKKPPSLLGKHRVLDRGLTAEIWRIMSLASRRKPADRPAASTVAAWLKFSNTVYNTSGDSEWDDSSERSPTPSSENVAGNWGGNRLKKPSTASLHATAVATDSYPHKPLYSESGNRKSSNNKYKQPPKIHYHDPTHATVPRPPPGTFQPVGAPMLSLPFR
ncbi:hypothetical protein BC629DRAFT_533500 [Irpex lacteus]|nr:hypothetical protein BC629DRAFT_533500 [Irpex lacteus]